MYAFLDHAYVHGAEPGEAAGRPPAFSDGFLGKSKCVHQGYLDPAVLARTSIAAHRSLPINGVHPAQAVCSGLGSFVRLSVRPADASQVSDHCEVGTWLMSISEQNLGTGSGGEVRRRRWRKAQKRQMGASIYLDKSSGL